MKRIFCFLSMFVMFFVFLDASADKVQAEEPAIRVYIDEEQISFDVPPQLIHDRTMVPMRAIFEYLGATVTWVEETQSIYAKKDDVTIQMQIDNPEMYVNGEKIVLDVSPTVIDSRTLVPVRAISEALHTTVQWAEANSSVHILTKNFMDALVQNLQGTWNYAYAIIDGQRVEIGSVPGMEVFRHPFTLEIQDVTAVLTSSLDNRKERGDVKYLEGQLQIFALPAEVDGNVLKLIVGENDAVILLKDDAEQQAVEEVLQNVFAGMLRKDYESIKKYALQGTKVYALIVAQEAWFKQHPEQKMNADQLPDMNAVLIDSVTVSGTEAVANIQILGAGASTSSGVGAATHWSYTNGIAELKNVDGVWYLAEVK